MDTRLETEFPVAAKTLGPVRTCAKSPEPAGKPQRDQKSTKNARTKKRVTKKSGKKHDKDTDSKAQSKTFDDGLPCSVRGQPEELRTTIRRRQNSESARRSHRRQMEQMNEMEEKYSKNMCRIQVLEHEVSRLEGELVGGPEFHSSPILTPPLGTVAMDGDYVHDRSDLL